MLCNDLLTGTHFSLLSPLWEAITNPHVRCGVALLQNVGRSMLSYPETEKNITVSRPVIFQIKGKKTQKICFFLFLLNSYVASWKPFRGFAFRTWNGFLTVRPKKTKVRGWRKLWPHASSQRQQGDVLSCLRWGRARPQILFTSCGTCFKDR